MFICTVILFIYGVILLLTKKQKENYGREKRLVKRLHLEKWIKKDRHRLQMQKLYPSENEEQMIFTFWYKKIHMMGVVFGVILILGMFSELSARLQPTLLSSDTKLVRPGYGEGSNTVSLEIKNDTIGTQKISIDVTEKVYEEKERQEAFRKAKDYIKSVYLGENQSNRMISKPLVLLEKIPNTSISVRWLLDEEGIILEDGSINKEKLKEEEKEVKVSAILVYQEWKEECSFILKVIPEQKTAKDWFWENFEKSRVALQEKTKKEAYLSLPQVIDGANVYYKEEDKSKSFVFLALAIMGSFFSMLQLDETLKKEEKKREEGLLLDYPCLVNKFVLLLGAGMTICGAFEKISQEYSKDKQRKGAKLKYAYEEMLITQKEIQNGISEVKAYERYGKRVKRLEYLKFSTLISQNLRKGSDHILELLEVEAIEAFEKRKEYAKKQGEEAGTKLLIPMMLMLILVMGIIIIPAFLSF